MFQAPRSAILSRRDQSAANSREKSASCEHLNAFRALAAPRGPIASINNYFMHLVVTFMREDACARARV
jgi:hypothetical protein